MIDDDIDAPEDFEKEEHAEKPSLREVWENNPALKLAAIVLGGAVLLGGYMIFFSKGDETTRAVIRAGDLATSKQVPGAKEVDPAYRAALEAANKKNAEDADKHGGSAIPLPIAVPKGSGLEIPEMPEKHKDDVLAEWKKVADAGRMKAAKEEIDEENVPVPEVVPTVQPIRPQPVAVKPDPNLAKNLAAQMRIIIGAQAPALPRDLKITTEESPYEKMKEAQEAQKATAAGGAGAGAAAGAVPAAGAGAAGTAAQTAAPKMIVPAGSIAYAQLLNQLDSDIPGPVLAQILSGPFSGGRLIGKISMVDDFIVITFSTVVKDTVSYKIAAVGLDQNTTLEGQATSVDKHYFDKVVLPAAAAFLTGYSSAISSPQQSQSATSGVGTQTTTSPYSPKQSLFKGLEAASSAYGSVLTKDANLPNTVIVNKGTTMGVFFTTSVTTGDAGK